MNVPTASLVATGGSATGNLGFAVRFQNNVSHLFVILDSIYLSTCACSLRRYCS